MKGGEKVGRTDSCETKCICSRVSFTGFFVHAAQIACLSTSHRDLAIKENTVYVWDAHNIEYNDTRHMRGICVQVCVFFLIGFLDGGPFGTRKDERQKGKRRLLSLSFVKWQGMMIVMLILRINKTLTSSVNSCIWDCKEAKDIFKAVNSLHVGHWLSICGPCVK